MISNHWLRISESHTLTPLSSDFISSYSASSQSSLFFRYAFLHASHSAIIHFGYCISDFWRNLCLFWCRNLCVIRIYSFLVLGFWFGFRIRVCLGSIFVWIVLEIDGFLWLFPHSLPLFSGFTGGWWFFVFGWWFQRGIWCETCRTGMSRRWHRLMRSFGF